MLILSMIVRLFDPLSGYPALLRLPVVNSALVILQIEGQGEREGATNQWQPVRVAALGDPN